MIFKATFLVSLAALALAWPPNNRFNGGMTKLQDDEVNFGLSFLNEIEVRNGGVRAAKNAAVSPNGLRTVLAMLAGGANGETLDQIQAVIGDSAVRSHQPRASTDYAQSLNLLGVQYRFSGDFTMLPAYLDLLKNKFAIDKRYENFHTYVNIWAQGDINQWISNKTHGDIPFFIDDPYKLEILTKMFVANAEYLHATWYWPILSSETTKQPWQLPSGATKLVEMMQFFGSLNYAQFADGQLVEIPFRDNGLNLLVFLPDPTKLAAATSVSELFNSIPFTTRLAALSQIYTYMSIPRYHEKPTAQSGHSAKDVLQTLGITDAFDVHKADFSGINGKRNLHLDDLYQQVSLRWNEDSARGGAGAGSVVVIPSSLVAKDEDIGAGGGIYPTPASIFMSLNSTFLYLVRDTNQAVPQTLFAGVVHDPQP